MTGVLGVSVASQELRAVLADRAGHVLWAASMPYGDPGEIITAIGRLAADCPGPAKRVRVVLERAVVQLRTRTSVPRLRPEAARRYVALERPRLFRQNGAPLVSDGQTLQIGPGEWVLWAGAAPDPLVAAVVRGCDEAGLALEALGPAADVLPHAVVDRSADGELVFPNGATCEVLSLARGVVWRSRFTAGVEAPAAPVWTPALRSLGDRAGQFAAAFAAATRRPRLQLLPADTLAVRRAAALRRLGAVALAGAVLWVAAAAVHGGRLAWTARTAQEQLLAMGTAVDRAIASRQDLHAARAALATVEEAERSRSRTLVLLGELTTLLGDSVFVAALQFQPDSTLRLAGYAPTAARALARLERAAWIRHPRFEGPVTRERVGPADQELDRFAIVARLRAAP